jgi:hypothetical protein
MSRRAIVVLGALSLVATAVAPAQARRTSPSLSFFSGGGGAHADWLHTDDQPAGDLDQQAFRVVATAVGYAGADVKHAEGLPTASYPASSFDFKANQAGPSLGSPRLMYFFSDGGRADLRPLVWEPEWNKVDGNNWDNNGGPCGFQFQRTWDEIKACHPNTIVTNIVFVADPGREVTFLVDNLAVLDTVISHARDNGAA